MENETEREYLRDIRGSLRVITIITCVLAPSILVLAFNVAIIAGKTK